MVDVAAALSAANQAITIAKAMRSIDKAYDLVALKSQVVDLMDKLQDVRGVLQDVREAMTEKDAEIADLKSLVDKRGATVEHNGYRYRPDPEDQSKPIGYPYCLRCDEVDHRLVGTVDNGRGVICPQCKSEYGRGATRFLWPNQRRTDEATANSDEPKIDDGAYIFAGQEGHYCTACWDSRRRKSLLTEQQAPFRIFGKWSCPVCKQTMGSGTA